MTLLCQDPIPTPVYMQWKHRTSRSQLTLCGLTNTTGRPSSCTPRPHTGQIRQERRILTSIGNVIKSTFHSFSSQHRWSRLVQGWFIKQIIAGYTENKNNTFLLTEYSSSVLESYCAMMKLSALYFRQLKLPHIDQIFLENTPHKTQLKKAHEIFTWKQCKRSIACLREKL